MNTQQIAAQGRYGDNTLVHASAGEVKGLDALSRSIYGHNLPRNPQTGLPEAFLFAPLMAPLLAGSISALAGMGAVGTGLLAGGLGAAEAAARGMDDPLQQGIMAGLTGGAAAGIGSALSGAGQAATTEAIKSAAAPTGTAASQAFGQGAQLPADWLLADAQQLAQQGLGADQIRSTLQAGVAPATTGQATSMLANPLQGSQFGPTGQFGPISQMGRGAKALMEPGAFKEGGVGQQFLKDAKMPAIAGSMGMMGQSALAQEQAMRDAEEDRKRRGEESRAKSMGYISDIAQQSPYSMVGQQYYNPYRPFASGGIVNLARGGVIGHDEYNRPLYAHHPLFDNPNFKKHYYELQDSGDWVWSIPEKLREDMYKDYTYDNYTVPSTGASYTVPSAGSTFNTSPGASGSSPGASSLPPSQRQDPQFQAFMRQLQRGAGNAKASYRSGYVGGGTRNAQPAVPAVKEEKMATGGYLDGGVVPGDGMSDSQPAMIDGQQPAALSSGEFVVPADVVSGLGNGSSDAGAQQLYAMMDRIRKARTGTSQQAPKVNPQRMMVA